MQEWQASVFIAGVPAVSEADMEAMQQVVRGIVTHKAGIQELGLSWRFTCESDTISSAIEHASFMWRAALGNASGIETVNPEVMCTDFRVRRAPSDEEAKAELKRIFKD